MTTAAQRIGAISISPASMLRRRTRELREAGRSIIDLSSGNLDFATPDHVIAAAHAAMRAGETRYTDVDGTPALKDAVGRSLLRDHGLTYGPDEVMVCTGSTQALYNALMATLDPGDEVIVPSPYWATYLEQIRLTGGVPVIVPCAPDNGFKINADDLESAITPRTRWLIVNNPVNPSGAVYTRDDLTALADVLARHPGVRVLADGLYEHIVFDDAPAPTMAAAAPWLKNRTLTIGGIAKSYAMMGWRIGYAGGPAPLIRDMIKIQSQITSGASSISQAAAIAALDGPPDLLRERAAILRNKRDLLVACLADCAGFACAAPKGTFYLMVSCAGLIGKGMPDGEIIATDREAAAYLLDHANVAVLPGVDFGLSPCLRVSFAASEASLEEAGDRLHSACAALR